MPETPKPVNRLKQLWREKRPTFGALATIPSVQTVQIMANSGLDWIIVDLEHGPIDLSAAHDMIVATSGTPCVPMVAVPAWHRRRVRRHQAVAGPRTPTRDRERGASGYARNRRDSREDCRQESFLHRAAG
jgi:hypothetical protein